MSETFSDINAEHKPGTALRTMVEEHRYLDEFMAMVRAKLELDGKYVSELRALRDSRNPNWVGSGIRPLVSPLLAHLDNEITERENAMAELTARFSALPKTPPPNSLDEDGFDPLDMIHDLETRYHEYDKAHKVIFTPESINELKKWQNKVAPRVLLHTPNEWVLPVSERTYRKAVIAQQETVERASKWAADNLADILERHQQRTEDVKSFSNLFFNTYGNIHTVLSTSCSAAVEGNRAFSSSRFIAPRHDEKEKEASHILLQMVHYHNYMLDGQAARPILGLGVERTASLLNQLSGQDRHYAVGLVSSPNWMTAAFQLEKDAVSNGLPALLKIQTGQEIYEIQRSTFLLDTPLLPLLENDVTQYRNGISRMRLSALMETYLPLERKAVLAVLLRLVAKTKKWHSTSTSAFREAAARLCHNAAAAGIVESIWRKWDIENDCPFPEGVERAWSDLTMRYEIVWKKSGQPYIATPDSSI